jgi:AICAR transformylase/IMP cyclohydrolase PurH
MSEQSHYADELKLTLKAVDHLEAVAEEDVLILVAEQVRQLRYGENAHQDPAYLYRFVGHDDPLGVPNFDILTGNAGWINHTDLEDTVNTARYMAAGLDVNYGQVPYIALGSKHGHISNAAESEDKETALRNALESDLIAIFGGTFMTNFEIDAEAAEIITTHKIERGAPTRKLDVILAPSVTDDALEKLVRKGDRMKAMVNPALASMSKDTLPKGKKMRQVSGGMLVQPYSCFVPDMSSPELTKSGVVDAELERAMIFAWAIGSTATSNTITLIDAPNRRMIGNGVGQQDRVSAVDLALTRSARASHSEEIFIFDTNETGVEQWPPRIVRKAPEKTVLYSDSYFPFPDGPEAIAEAGIRAVLGTHGSINDDKVFDSFEATGVSFYHYPDSVARGFAKH